MPAARQDTTFTEPAWYFPAVEAKARARFGCFPVPCRAIPDNIGEDREALPMFGEVTIFALITDKTSQRGSSCMDYKAHYGFLNDTAIRRLEVEPCRVVIMSHLDFHKLPPALAVEKYQENPGPKTAK